MRASEEHKAFSPQQNPLPARFSRNMLNEALNRPGNGSLAIISLLPREAMQLQLEVETKKRSIINQCIKNCLVEKIDSRKIHIGVVGRSSVMSEAKKY